MVVPCNPGTKAKTKQVYFVYGALGAESILDVGNNL